MCRKRRPPGRGAGARVLSRSRRYAQVARVPPTPSTVDVPRAPVKRFLRAPCPSPRPGSRRPRGRPWGRGRVPWRGSSRSRCGRCAPRRSSADGQVAAGGESGAEGRVVRSPQAAAGVGGGAAEGVPQLMERGGVGGVVVVEDALADQAVQGRLGHGPRGDDGPAHAVPAVLQVALGEPLGRHQILHIRLIRVPLSCPATMLALPEAVVTRRLRPRCRPDTGDPLFP